jgi:hypothetical protein
MHGQGFHPASMIFGLTSSKPWSPWSACGGWEDIECREFCLSLFNEDQTALWAIWGVDLEIENGGFIQFFENSYGEIAEEAVHGFRRFNMNGYADLLKEAFNKFERPIPIGREDRWRMVQRRLGLNVVGMKSTREQNTMAYMRGNLLLDGLDIRYAELKEAEGYFIEVLCHKVEERRASFFRLTD